MNILQGKTTNLWNKNFDTLLSFNFLLFFPELVYMFTHISVEWILIDSYRALELLLIVKTNSTSHK